MFYRKYHGFNTTDIPKINDISMTDQKSVLHRPKKAVEGAESSTTFLSTKKALFSRPLGAKEIPKLPSQKVIYTVYIYIRIYIYTYMYIYIEYYVYNYTCTWNTSCTSTRISVTAPVCTVFIVTGKCAILVVGIRNPTGICLALRIFRTL